MPGEFTDDAIKTVECAIVTNGKIDVETLVSNLGWTSIRAETCLEGLLHNGTAWFDQIESRTGSAIMSIILDTHR